MRGPPILLIAGPTASGKSNAALQIAENSGGEIVGADSMQIYRDLRILTARPSAEEEARAPHHLVGCVDAADGWSVGRWAEAAKQAIDAIRAKGKVALVVGGTGLYFRALTHGLAAMPRVPDAARQAAELRFHNEGEAGFRAALRSYDPKAEARIAPGDRQRLVRAMAVYTATGKPLSRWQEDTQPLLPADSWHGVILEPPRDELYARCDARLAAMVEAGALDEVKALLDRGLPPEQPVMKAVGVREFSDHLQGRTSLDEALTLAQQATRNYAKRQMTWFRNQTPDWERVAANGPA